MGRKKKDADAWEDLDADFRTEVDSMTREQIEHRIAAVAMYNVELMKAKKEDQDLQEKKDQVTLANEPYKLGSKQIRLKIEYCKQSLDGQGGPVKAK
jgi:hypothetical protein